MLEAAAVELIAAVFNIEVGSAYAVASLAAAGSANGVITLGILLEPRAAGAAGGMSTVSGPSGTSVTVITL